MVQHTAALRGLRPVAKAFGLSVWARSIFGLFSLPPLAGQDQAASEAVFYVHFLAAMLMLLLIGAHVGAALFHYFIRRDGVLRRMLPGLARR